MIDLFDIETELVVGIRNNITDPRSTSVNTNKSETFSGDDIETVFELTGDLDSNNNHTFKNVQYVKIGGVTQTRYTDYTVTYNGTNVGKITFTTAPVTGTDNIEINYDYGSGWIFSFYPRPDITVKDAPRIGMDLNIDTSPLGTGNRFVESTITASIIVVSGSTLQVKSLATLIRNWMLENRTSFYNFHYFHNIRMSPVTPYSEDNLYLYQRTIDFDVILETEAVT